MSSEQVQIRAGDCWLTTLAHWGELRVTTDLHGPAAVEWKMELPATFTHPALRRGRRVELLVGPILVWSGLLAEPSFGEVNEPWSFHADGLAHAAGDYLALDEDGEPSTIPDVAVDAAIARGLPWSRPESLSTDPAADRDLGTTPQRLDQLLDLWAASAGSVWAVDADGQIRGHAAPGTQTAPDWYMTPGSGRYGTADDDFASDLYLWTHDDASPDIYRLAHVGDDDARTTYGRREELVDLTSLGVIPTPTATLMGNSILAGAREPEWTNPVTPSLHQLTNPGGIAASPWLVHAGQVVRLHGVLTDLGQPLPHVDFVIGKTSYAAGTDTITLTPTAYAARDLAGVLADARVTRAHRRLLGL